MQRPPSQGTPAPPPDKKPAAGHENAAAAPSSAPATASAPSTSAAPSSAAAAAASSSAGAAASPAPAAEASSSRLFPVRLDAADGHLDLQVDAESGLSASCLHTNGFQYTWKGIRTTIGVRGAGKFYFETKVTGTPEVVMPETPPNTRNVCRIGVSLPLSSLYLGETADSWGYGGTAKKSFSRRFETYGEAYGLGDVVGTLIDLDNLRLALTKNGKALGTAYELPARVRDTGLFPHLYLKNVDVQLNVTAATQWFAPPDAQARFIGDVPEEELLPNPVEHPESAKECEFLMMTGLPACGKTVWVERHCAAHPRKSYVVLGTNAIIDQMRVMGVKRQQNYASRWDELMSTATSVFNALVGIASSGRVPRNVIIDQTNVFRNARRRKVQPFYAWGIRRAVTIVTDEATLQQRTAKREQEEGKMVPVAAVMDMKAAFVLPSYEDGFTVIEYPELPEQESRIELRRINDEGRRFKRENQNACSNQPKPHIETRQADEIGTNSTDSRKRARGDMPDEGRWGGGYYYPPFFNQGPGAPRESGPPGVWAGNREGCYPPPQPPAQGGDRAGHGSDARAPGFYGEGDKRQRLGSEAWSYPPPGRYRAGDKAAGAHVRPGWASANSQNYRPPHPNPSYAASCPYGGSRGAPDARGSLASSPGQGPESGDRAGGPGANGYGYGPPGSAGYRDGYGREPADHTGGTGANGYGYGPPGSGGPGANGYGYGPPGSAGYGNGYGREPADHTGGPGANGYGYGPPGSAGYRDGYGREPPGSAGYGNGYGREPADHTGGPGANGYGYGPPGSAGYGDGYGREPADHTGGTGANGYGYGPPGSGGPGANGYGYGPPGSGGPGANGYGYGPPGSAGYGDGYGREPADHTGGPGANGYGYGPPGSAGYGDGYGREPADHTGGTGANGYGYGPPGSGGPGANGYGYGPPGSAGYGDGYGREPADHTGGPGANGYGYGPPGSGGPGANGYGYGPPGSAPTCKGNQPGPGSGFCGYQQPRTQGGAAPGYGGWGGQGGGCTPPGY
ncbi:SPRY domain-containing protein [Besnoitia besnoiti]|uniref:SPRY domain-containing protein n=1 Tax=Besnoitia besnoiti TaxID=94643 RepID=A0A2A9M9K4_BESBE|nr:SPRY domain-containing protein [Besnoitia besnoiti]PFH32052.1 SPRY domain-containing protein [Besnoitia besnoiti]